MSKTNWLDLLIMKNTDVWKTKQVIPPKMEHPADELQIVVNLSDQALLFQRAQ